MNTTTGNKQAIRDYLATIGLTYAATFQPRPQPRESVKHPRLHWLVTLSNGKQVAQFPYSEGVGHVKGYQAYHKTRYDTAQAEARYRKTCETGLVQEREFSRPITQPAPDMLDVLYCLVSDASVRHASTYEEWAAEYGYDADSRKGEQVYRDCQKQTTDLLRVLGGGTVGRAALERLEKLEELFQDY